MRLAIILLVAFFSISFSGVVSAETDNASTQSAYDYLIRVSIAEKVLYMYEYGDDGSQKQLKIYSVAVPRRKYYDVPLNGEVAKAILNPSWFPPEGIRKASEKKGYPLPKHIPPGSPGNAMGKGKLVIDFSNTQMAIRIHGNNNPASIGTASSSGCIRMYNADIIEICNLVNGKKTKVVIM